MDLEFSWLIAFIVFFALGWISARFDIKQLLSKSRKLPDSYFKGLNFLINEQPDQAIQALIQAVDIDHETLELHFALGQLFRRRGELNRAILIHQNLLARIDLDNSQRLKAQYELAQDFFKSGLHDRAEQLLVHLVQHKYTEQLYQDYYLLGLNSLLTLYITQKEWLSAINIAQQLNENNHLNYLMTQFYCELAQVHIDASNYVLARQYLTQAEDCYPNSSRIYILHGDIYSRELNYQKAIDAWLSIESIAPQMIPVIAERLLLHYRYLNEMNQGIKTLVDIQHRYDSIDLTQVIFDGLYSMQRYKDAYFFIQETLRKKPNLIGLEKLLEIQILESQTTERRADLELIKNLIAEQIKNAKRFQCGKCHFKTTQFYWQCPACGEWDNYHMH